MKKIFIAFILFICSLGFFQTVFAEANVNTTSIQVDEKLNTGLEDFFGKTLNQDYESAYKMMDDSFIKSTPLEDFKLILTETKLTTFNKKIWTSLKKEMMGVLATINGEFFAPNEEIHHITFEIFIDAHKIKIRNISENIALQDLKKRFPAAKILRPQAEKDLRAITDFLQRREFKKLYAYLSSNAKNRITRGNIWKTIVVLKKSKFDIGIPENAVVSIGKKPILTKDGTMRVHGNFHNKTSKIHFALDYDYQWKWKLGNFRFNVRPLPLGNL